MIPYPLIFPRAKEGVVGLSLEEIPLMVSIAWHSFGAFMGRQEG